MGCLAATRKKSGHNDLASRDRAQVGAMLCGIVGTNTKHGHPAISVFLTRRHLMCGSR
jgi:hypothetical protein